MERYKRLSDYRPPPPKLRVGGEVETWCTHCRQVENHTVLAMQENTPVRVMCNSCRSQHNFRSNQNHPSASRKGSSQSGVKKSADPGSGSYRSAKAWLETIQDKDLSNPVNYHPDQAYQPGQVILHPKFGKGVVVLTKEGNKITVIFEDKTRVLMHSRALGS